MNISSKLSVDKALQRWLVAGVVLLLMLLTVPLQAAEYDALKQRIEDALQQDSGAKIVVTSIETTSAPGLLKATLADGPDLYVTEGGDFFVSGDLWSFADSALTNLSEQDRIAQRKLVIDAIAREDMIIFSPQGKPRGHITVFTDTTCFYCQKLHGEVGDLNDRGIEVRYLAYPRSGLDSDGARQLETAWCADDQQATLTALKNGKKVPEQVCNEAPIAEQFQLGVQLGVRGTPAIITGDGQMIPGYRPAADIEKLLGL